MNLFYANPLYAAASQILNDNFYQNPAELSLVNHAQLIAGNLFISPKFEFNGTAFGNSGRITSEVHDSLPYLLSAYRFTDRFVFGINVTPSSYGHLEWPIDSFVAPASTVTDLMYYRIGAQSSYQVTPTLALGLGLNLEYNKKSKMYFVIPGLGNQENRISAMNHSADVGLFYNINEFNSLTAAIYTPVNTFGSGTSTLGNTRSDDLSLTVSEASVAYVGLLHTLTDRWSLAEKVYWSGWSIQKTLTFLNTTTGNLSVPTNWKDIWSFQLSTRYAVTDRVALLGFMSYDTNPIDAAFNQIGYPLAPVGSLAGGLDLGLYRGLSAQVVYGYAAFMPTALIGSPSCSGRESLNLQAVTLQLTYKV